MGPVASVDRVALDSDDVFPDDILLEVLLQIPARDLLKSCVLVSRQWRSLIESKSLWKRKCAKDLGYSEKMIHILGDDNFKIIYLQNPYKSNLIRNPDASEKYKHWKILERGGDRFALEDVPVGSHHVEDYIDDSLKTPGKITSCWASSFRVCSKEQVIDLKERGISERVMDELQPDLHVSEWYAARFDCGCRYAVKVQLLASNKTTVIQKWEFDDTLQSGRAWFKAENTFKQYGPGVRYIRFYHQGVDTQFWKGWFGAKMTLATVKFHL